MYDGAAVAVMDLGAVLRCDVPAGTDWFVAEGCHLVPQGDFSVSAPFSLEQLEQMAAAASYRGVQIRTVPNRRIPRAWSEIEPDMPWADRDKDRDTEVWYRWLTARPERLLSLKRWTPGFHSPADHIEELRGEVMRDVNMVRQWRQVPDSPQYMDFTQRVNRALLQAMVPSGYDVVSVATRLGCPRKGVMRGKPYWNAAGCIYLDDAYCVARNAKTGDARNLSGRTVRKVCGLHANGYPNQVRSDLRHHAKSLGYTPTSIDRDFVTMVRYLAASGSGSNRETKEGPAT
jgi:hypothetical protein